MKLTAKLIVIVAIAVTITDLVDYIHIKQNPEHLTIPLGAVLAKAAKEGMIVCSEKSSKSSWAWSQVS